VPEFKILANIIGFMEANGVTAKVVKGNLVVVRTILRLPLALL
jgi:hypothetical protein